MVNAQSPTQESKQEQKKAELSLIAAHFSGPLPHPDLTLIGKSDVEKERSTKQQRRKWYEYRNVAECRSMGSGDLRGGRIGRSTTHRSVGQGGIGPGRKPFGLLACEHAQLGGYPCGLSVSGQSSHQP